MPLFIQYVTLLSGPTCYIGLTLQNSSTVKTDLKYYSGGVQVQLVFLKFGCCSLRMLSQDLVFLLCLPLPHQSSHQSQVLCKTNFINMSLAERQISLSISSCILNCLNQVYATTKMELSNMFIIEASAALLFLSCTFRRLQHTLHNVSHCSCKRSLSFMVCCKTFRNCNLPAKEYTLSGAMKKSKAAAMLILRGWKKKM